MKNPSATAELKRELEQDIIEGRVLPGERLDEASLAQRFNISRTPVREALRELTITGLVELRPRRGVIVTQLSLKVLLEMFELMAELEGMCGRLAAVRMTEKERHYLLSVHQSSQKAADNNDYDTYYAINVEWHETIYRGCHNGFLAGQTRALRNRLAPYRRMQLRRHNRLSESFTEHGQIVEAILAGQAEQAEQLLRAHVTSQGGSYNDFIASLPAELLGQ